MYVGFISFMYFRDQVKLEMCMVSKDEGQNYLTT